jgi:hypothetical protein
VDANPVILTPARLDQLRQVVADGDSTKALALVPDGVTLGAALECACWWNDSMPLPFVLEGWRDLWLRQYPALALARRLIDYGYADEGVQPPLSAPHHELRLLASRDDLLNEGWDLFLDRFRRSLDKLGGFSRSAAATISGALHEMADNLVQHSGPDADSPARGLSGFHVAPNQFSFSVVDLGRGVLESLRANPRWAALSNSTRALEAAVRDHATRRPEREYGEGFLNLYEWLADLNGVLRFRSGDGVLRIVGRGEHREGTPGFTAPLSGFQVTVTCARNGPPQDIPL